ncbi:MAG: IPExxxVDY family protein [Bacteroidales bacterium]|nr:IPExxxVDY family protein [Bacteroidales bacterium]
MVRRKNKIVVEPFDDIRIIGINSHLEDYKLAWHINNVLNINLIKYSDIVNEDGQAFSFYLYDGGENSNAFNLVGLVNEEAKWIKLPLPTDYLIVIRNFITEDSYQAITSKIKQIPGVILVYNVDVEKTRKIDNLLEDIEIHEIELIKSRD